MNKENNKNPKAGSKNTENSNSQRRNTTRNTTRNTSNSSPRKVATSTNKEVSNKDSNSKRPSNNYKRRRTDNNNRHYSQKRSSKPDSTQMSSTSTPALPTSSKILKVCALSGTNEVGRNCNFVELGDEIVMVDCGLAFPNSELHGVDYIIPNTKYLKQKKRNIKAILITHGHLDHIGALPYILPDLGFPTIYASDVANEIIKGRLAEFKMDKKAKLVNVVDGQRIKLGNFTAEFTHVTHSIPGCYSIFIESPKGNVFVSGDYKTDTNPLIEKETNYAAHEKFKGRVDIALMESTRANAPGHSKTETELQETLHKLISGLRGRVVIASFASNISRMYIAGTIAKRLNRKVFVSGRSSLNMLELAKKLGYLKGIADIFLPATELRKYKDHQVLFLCTGSQGERYGALNLMSLGDHRQFKIKRGDQIIRSSSDIPGNELEIEQMTSRIIARGADLINNKEVEVHYGGHGSQGDMKRMFDLIQPKNVMPVHGHMTLRYYNQQNMFKWGMKRENVFLTDDGAVWSSSNNGKSWKRSHQVEAKQVLVDGLGVGDIGDLVIRDRHQLSEYGMVVTVLNLSSRSKTIIGRPRFVSRGFVYLKTSEKLFKSMEAIVRESHERWIEAASKTGRFEYTKLSKDLEKKLSKFIYKQTEREPMILTHIS